MLCLSNIGKALASKNFTNFLPSVYFQALHTSSPATKKDLVFSEPTRWPVYNDQIFPPQSPDEPRRPAFVCHMKTNIKYSPKKLWYVACFVRGMSVDEAIDQLKFVPRKGAEAVRQCIEEAQKLAVEEHNVEFKSNLWVAESRVAKGITIKGIRRHAKMRMGCIKYRYSHYLVRLEEGKPPAKGEYYWHGPNDGPSLLDDWLAMMRRRKIISSL
ncbi:39S ribosomal protein L22, mitochondrial isoform X2 [Nilaparvata lugens]|nr:39S ribosomal protein L22, mitochondrial isoform X2 [Nilaparvata lugens]XP_039281137.1 39S ribosomal protein L22, mitochondrial isoform X2 [Nilaparvata lugens]XP_039281138.1 39S ribosomal protein L22, mitochondrial isoform X2 [Nilaparvata lugens]XP_039281139.1 39S ribosomal protein L22, mitochondrial isoform X2 [Nilaparvata lugens]